MTSSTTIFADYNFTDQNTSLHSIMSWLDPFELGSQESYWDYSEPPSTESSNQSSPSLGSSQSNINIDFHPEMLPSGSQPSNMNSTMRRVSSPSDQEQPISKKTTNRVERRRLQNREAQKNFRKRKEVQLQAALEELIVLRSENQNLEAVIAKLKTQFKLWQTNRSFSPEMFQ